VTKCIALVITIILFGLSNQVSAYPAAWEDFDPADLNSVRDETMGNTQKMLDERGSIECIACHGETDDEYDGVLSTAEIITGTMEAALSCLSWEVKGICIWMTCIGPICEFDVSVKVANFVPELTVQSYDRANGEPWTESQDINQISQGDTESSWVFGLIGLIEDFDVEDVGIRGGHMTQAKKDQHQNLSFKLTDAYGNPGITLFNELADSTGGYACQGTTTMFYPYFISNLDAIAWRWDIPEMFYPQSWAGFILYDLGDLSNNYGAIYPRHGFQTSQDPLKAAVLVAYRAAHFITRSTQPHVYFDIDKDSEDGYWPPGPLEEGDEDTGMWQMLYPEMEDSCEEFPYGGNPSGDQRSEDGSYIWNFWRKFSCCERQGQVLVYHGPD